MLNVASPALPRRDAVVMKILADFSAHPVLTTASAATRYGVSAVAAHRALSELADAGVLGRSKNHKGKIVCYTADAHLGLTALAERANRVGAGDTDHRRPDQGPPAPAAGRFGPLRTD